MNKKEIDDLTDWLIDREECVNERKTANKKYIVQLTDEQYRNLVDVIRKEVKKEFEQKVKDKIEEAKYNKKEGNTAYEYTEEDVWDIVKDVLEELL